MPKLVILHRSGVKKILGDRSLHLALLLLWMVVGAGLRFANLESKPPWTDEFSTMVFSLGNSFRVVPLDQVISLGQLLEPLRPRPEAGVADVIRHLMTESTHPPVYFVLAHPWMKGFPTEAGLVNLWGARSLAALLGVLSIPAVFGLGWLAFGSRQVGQLAAAVMAVSPYGIFLSQEARHYTLAILAVIASLACLVQSLRHLERRSPLPLWLGLLWVGINSLGIAIHYLFALTLMAEALVLLGIWLLPLSSAPGKLRHLPLGIAQLGKTNAWRLGAIALGTFVGGLVWLPEVRQSHGSNLTEWITFDWDYPLSLVNPIVQLLAAWITMLSLLPVEADALPVVLLSGALMLAFFVWITPRLLGGLQAWRSDPIGHRSLHLLVGFVGGAIALFLLFSYGLGKDLTRGARYNFVYFPAVMVLLGASLAPWWSGRGEGNALQVGTRKVVAIALLMGFLSGVTVVANLGYQKYYRPDQLARLIQEPMQTGSLPPRALVVTTHQTHVHTGEMMGVAREFQRQADPGAGTVQFLLAHYQQDAQETLPKIERAIATLPRPFDLWMVNLKTKLPPPPPNCTPDPQYHSGTAALRVEGYKYQMYRCR